MCVLDEQNTVSQEKQVLLTSLISAFFHFSSILFIYHLLTIKLSLGDCYF